MILTPEPVCLFVEHTIPRERFLSLAIFPFDRGDHAVDARLDLGNGVARDAEARRHLADGTDGLPLQEQAEIKV